MIPITPDMIMAAGQILPSLGGGAREAPAKHSQQDAHDELQAKMAETYAAGASGAGNHMQNLMASALSGVRSKRGTP